MNHLLRDLAPLTAEAWEVVDAEARTRLTELLAARKLVDFAGPHGWQRSAIELGSVDVIDAPGAALAAKQRRVQPLVELRASFTVPRSTLDDIARGRPDPDLDTLADAVRAIAAGGEHCRVPRLRGGWHRRPDRGVVAKPDHARRRLRRLSHVGRQGDQRVAHCAGIVGPFGLAIGPDGYTGIVETAENGGYPLIRHLHRDPGRPTRLVARRDRSRADQHPRRRLPVRLRPGPVDRLPAATTPTRSQLYLEESFTFRVLEPDAAVALV